MNAFRGGSYRFRLRMENGFMSGLGGRNMGLAGASSSLVRDLSAAFHHPATLAHMRHRQVYAEFAPPLGLNPSTFHDLDPTIQSQVDEHLAEYDLPKEALSYPAVQASFGQTGGVSAAGVVLPLRAGSLAIGFNRPLQLDVDMVGSGFHTLVETSKEVGNGRTLVQFSAQADLQARLQANVASFSAGYGTAISRRLLVGIQAEQLRIRTRLTGNAKIDGIMVLRQEGASQGTEYAFNDPYDTSIRREAGEQNDLNQSAAGEFSGNTWQGRIALAWFAQRTWSFDAIFHLSRPATLRGHFEFIQNRVPAINAESLFGAEGEILDVSQLNLSKPTLTTRYENPTSDELELSFPSSLTLGTSRVLAHKLFILNTTIYFGEFSYRFQQHMQGFAPKWSLKLASELPVPWFAGPETAILRAFGFDTPARLLIGLGFMSADEVKSGFRYQSSPDDRTAKGIMIPSFGLGKVVGFSRRWQMALVYFSLPGSLLKASFMVNLDSPKPRREIETEPEDGS